jgi:hypothetical protein
MSTSFTPIYVLRSDSKSKTRTTDGEWQTNEPTPEQLRKSTKIDKRNVTVLDYYRELKYGDQKYTDWMLKLGALYALHCGDAEMKGCFDFPLIC